MVIQWSFFWVEMNMEPPQQQIKSLESETHRTLPNLQRLSFTPPPFYCVKILDTASFQISDYLIEQPMAIYKNTITQNRKPNHILNGKPNQQSSKNLIHDLSNCNLNLDLIQIQTFFKIQTHHSLIIRYQIFFNIFSITMLLLSSSLCYKFPGVEHKLGKRALGKY